MKDFVKKLNTGLSHNHWIVTEYESKDDNIGFHSDKDKNFDAESYFIVIKLGEPRKFEFRMKRSKENPNPKPFFSQTLSAGTAIFVRTKSEDGLDANSIVEHGVPPLKKAVGSSGSVVSRIVTRIPWEQVQKNIKPAMKSRMSRERKKKEVEK
jgi:hypothetical protein